MRLVVAIGLSLSLAACATRWEPADEPVVETRVRQPAQQDGAGTQVYPLRNPAVTVSWKLCPKLPMKNVP